MPQTYMFSLSNSRYFLQTNTQISVTGKLVWNDGAADMTPGTHTRPNNQNPSNIISLEIIFPSCGVQPFKINNTTSKLVRINQIKFDETMELREGDTAANQPPFEGMNQIPTQKYGVDANGKLTSIDIYLETNVMILGQSRRVFLELRCGDDDDNNCNQMKVGMIQMNDGLVDSHSVMGIFYTAISSLLSYSGYLLFSGDFDMVSYCIPKFMVVFFKKGASNASFFLPYWYPNFNSGRNGALGMDLDFATTTPLPGGVLGTDFLIEPTFSDESNIIDNNVSEIGSFQILSWDEYVKIMEESFEGEDGEEDLEVAFPKYDWGCGGLILQSIDVKIGEQKLFTEDIAQPAPLEEHLGVMPNQRIYITAQDPRYFEISINSVAEPECTSTTKKVIPEFLRDRKIAKMGRSAVMSSQRSTLRSQLRKMGTLGFQATKGKLSAGSYKKDVVIRRKPKTLRAGGSDYIQLKKWRALSHGKGPTPGTDTIPISHDFWAEGQDELPSCILL